MQDRQTKTIGEVGRATYQKDEASVPRKPVSGEDLGYCVLAFLHWEGKRRVVFISVRNWYDVGGIENGALLIPPPTASLVVQCSALISSSRSQTKKNFRHNRGQKNVFKGVGAGNLEKKKRTHHWMRIFRQSCTLHSPLSIERPTIGQQ